MKTMRLAAALLVATGIPALAQSKANTTPDLSKEWPTYGHDSGGMRFSPVAQINTTNVDKLKVAWVYHMRPANMPAAQPAPPAGRI